MNLLVSSALPRVTARGLPLARSPLRRDGIELRGLVIASIQAIEMTQSVSIPPPDWGVGVSP
jgi:hypothetical protein